MTVHHFAHIRFANMEFPTAPLRLCNDSYLQFMKKNNNKPEPIEPCCTLEAIRAFQGGANRIPTRLRFLDDGDTQDAVLVNATQCTEHEFRLKLELPNGNLLTVIAWIPENPVFIVSWLEDTPSICVVLLAP